MNKLITGIASVIAAMTVLAPAREAEIPVLMYHHISDEGDASVTLPPERFEEQMKALSDAGYTTVTFDELYDYTARGGELPDKPIVIVFDDGYRSVYENAFPVLENYGMKATACVIGWSVGKDERDNVIPHFDWDEANEMIDSGVFTIGSHTYDMHDRAVKRDGESAGDFTVRFTEDYNRLSDDIYRETGGSVTVFAYPHGIYDELTESLLENLGARVTLTTDAGMNTVRRGHPEDLYLMKRYNIGGETDIDALLGTIKKSEK